MHVWILLQVKKIKIKFQLVSQNLKHFLATNFLFINFKDFPPLNIKSYLNVDESKMLFCYTTINKLNGETIFYVMLEEEYFTFTTNYNSYK